MKFKVGDRVAVYEGAYRSTGKVIFIDKYSCLNIVPDEEDSPFDKDDHWSPKQCRKLVKKQRRSIWINPHPTPNGTLWNYCPENNFVSLNNPPNTNWIEFIEVKRK